MTALPARSGVVGSDMQNFNPTYSGLDFVTVHSSETLKPGIVNLGVYLNYAVNALPYFDDSPQGRLNVNDSLLGLDLNAGFGIMENWDIGVSFPQVLRQRVDDQFGPRGEFASTGSTEIRLATKYRVTGDDTGGVALVASLGFNRVENNPYMGTNPGPTTNLEVAADTTIGRYAIGGNIGYRIRRPGTPIPSSIAQPLGDQIIASSAVSYHMPDLNTKLIGELFGSLPAGDDTGFGARSLSSLELLAGAKHDINTNLALHAGAGAGVVQGTASPDWRVYTGLNYTFGPVFENKPASGQHLTFVDVPNEPKAERFRTQSILFEFDSDVMLGNYAPVLEELAAHLKSGFKELVIEGHTDSLGSDTYNQRLSLRRAAAIERYLVSKLGIPGAKIKSVGLGESRPIADNGNYQGRQQNRRVEFVVRR